jgi:hypothetical protein
VIEHWKQQLQQASLEDDDCEDLFLSTFIMNHIRADFETQKRKHGGSLSERKANLKRERQCGQDRISREYFCASPMYDDKMFRRRYRMR